MESRGGISSCSAAFSEPIWLATRDSMMARGFMTVIETKTSHYTAYHGTARIFMCILAAILLVIAGLLTGLILALCGLDMVWLQLRRVTGTRKERERILVITKMKTHGTWMLCSLIIITVACSEYFPFIIQGVFPGESTWVSVLISTCCIAIFVEILPQYLIPARPIMWGYYCWPMIWACMWLTAIVSYPLALILDNIGLQRKDNTIFTNDELACFIKFHDRSEKNGGQVGHDAARIVAGALNLDSQRIGGTISNGTNLNSLNNEMDVEKAAVTSPNSMIVNWSLVKTVDIDEIVDDSFIRKVKDWAYSRVPVLGRPFGEDNRDSNIDDAWDGTQIYGFLHMKSLVGFEPKGKGTAADGFTVKDLPLYPVPIVREDMSVYALLNLFQLGMSRMAIVVPAPKSDTTTASRHISISLPSATPMSPMRWTCEQPLAFTARHGSMDWINKAPKMHESIEAALTDPDGRSHNFQRVLGTKTPKPVGIITFEDLLDTLLQKTSHDEKDLFGHGVGITPGKSKKAGDYVTDPQIHHDRKHTSTGVQQVSFAKSTLRHRKASHKDKGVLAMDGADEHGLDNISSPRVRIRYPCSSSYTQNSRGGSHARTDSAVSAEGSFALSAKDMAQFTKKSSSVYPGKSFSLSKSATLPSRNAMSGVIKNPLRHASAAPQLPQPPQLRRVTPFSRQNFSNLESVDGDQIVDPSPGFVVPISRAAVTTVAAVSRRPSSENGAESSALDVYKIKSHHEERSDTVTISSFFGYGGNNDDVSMYDAFPVSVAEGSSCPESAEPVDKRKIRLYDGFPMELLDGENKENRAPNYASKTMPQFTPLLRHHSINHSSETLARELSFHDDRAMLPSQKKALNHSTNNDDGPYRSPRSTSLWF